MASPKGVWVIICNFIEKQILLPFQDLILSKFFLCDLLTSYICTYTNCKLNFQEGVLWLTLLSLCTTLFYKGNLESIGYSLNPHKMDRSACLGGKITFLIWPWSFLNKLRTDWWDHLASDNNNPSKYHDSMVKWVHFLSFHFLSHSFESYDNFLFCFSWSSCGTLLTIFMHNVIKQCSLVHINSIALFCKNWQPLSLWFWEFCLLFTISLWAPHIAMAKIQYYWEHLEKKWAFKVY